MRYSRNLSAVLRQHQQQIRSIPGVVNIVVGIEGNAETLIVLRNHEASANIDKDIHSLVGEQTPVVYRDL